MALAGVRVLVTRAAEDAPELEDLLRARGAIPVRMPCIAFEDGPDVGRIVQTVRNAQSGRSDRIDLIVVSSPHAARRLVELVGTPEIPFAAVGSATAALLPGKVIVPRTGVGAAALAAELAPLAKKKIIFFPRAEGADPGLAERLRAAGAVVDSPILYKTVTPPAADPAGLQALRDGQVDAISFASGSAVKGFAALAGPALASPCAVACIGSATAAEAAAAGIRVDAGGEGGLAELCDALALAMAARNG